MSILALLALGNLAPWPQYDDPSCHEVVTIVSGDDYHDGAWFHADGVLFAIAPEEDMCLVAVPAI